jgi:hypothetical protein
MDDTDEQVLDDFLNELLDEGRGNSGERLDSDLLAGLLPQPSMEGTGAVGKRASELVLSPAAESGGNKEARVGPSAEVRQGNGRQRGGTEQHTLGPRT